MAVYVDGLVNYGNTSTTTPACFRNRESCHMYADTREELDKMADRIGLKRSWIQKSPTLLHYDLVPSKRVLAIQYGAIEQNRHDAVMKWRELREWAKLGVE